MRSDRNRLLVSDGDPAGVDAAARAAAAAEFAFATAAPAEFPTLVDDFRPTLVLLDLDAAGAEVGDLLQLLAVREDAPGVLLASGGGAGVLADAAALATAAGLAVRGTLAKPLDAQALATLLGSAPAAARAVDAADLARGLAAGELVPFFQPQARNADGWRIDGVEALVRWRHPRHGLVSPEDFIPLAERAGLIGPVTEHVIAASLAELERWNAAGLPLRCAVNLPPSLVVDALLPERLAKLLDAHGLDATQLELEVTETATMREPTAALDVLTRARALGIGVSLDDFGIGYSSLTRLHELPFDEMKIDKSLIASLPHSPSAATMVGSLIELGHNLGLEVCAEGVESRAALDLLEALGCDRCQGYFLSRALPAADIPELVASLNGNGATGSRLRRAAAAS